VVVQQIPTVAMSFQSPQMKQRDSTCMSKLNRLCRQSLIWRGVL
jgi:hypothetical protein